jgi:glutamate-1-semialdehyde 2,1-aminomutase
MGIAFVLVSRMQSMSNLNAARLAATRAREDACFRARTPNSEAMQLRASAHLPNGVPMAWMAGLYRTAPIYCESGSGARFRDIDGNEYLDFNVADLSMSAGFGPQPIVAAVSAQMERGAHFLLPTRDAVEVAEKLSELVGLPYWQATLSATSANGEVIRIARIATGRERIVVFGGHYHGHLEETLVKTVNGRVTAEVSGLPRHAGAATRILPFNDLATLERELRSEQVALVLTEPALSNCNIVLPDDGFLRGARELTARYGTLLCLDEAHTFQFAYGGLTRAWSLEADFVVLGKGLGTGIPFGLYGMSAFLGQLCTQQLDVDIGPRGIGTGGTLYASAIALAAARAALDHLLRPEDYTRVGSLGQRLADGLERLFSRHDLAWRAFRLGPRSGYCLEPELPHNGQEAARSIDVDFIDTRRVYFANRGVWDAVASAGPQASLAHTAADIDCYLAVAEEFLSDIV